MKEKILEIGCWLIMVKPEGYAAAGDCEKKIRFPHFISNIPSKIEINNMPVSKSNTNTKSHT